MNPYREKIILSYKFLIKAHEELLTRTINVWMLGELAEVNSVNEEGDIFNFDPEMFRDSKDQNVQLLLNYFDNLEDLMNSLANINAITEEELDDFEDEEEL